jgi:hypothetical protein
VNGKQVETPGKEDKRMKKTLMMIAMMLVAGWAFGQETDPVLEQFRLLRESGDVQGMEQFITDNIEHRLAISAMAFVVNKSQDRIGKFEEFKKMRQLTEWQQARIGFFIYSRGMQKNDCIKVIAATGHTDLYIFRGLDKTLLSKEELIEIYTNVLKNTPLMERNKDFLSTVKAEMLKLKDI